MASALPPEEYIYQGVWINWLNGGKIFGATLTVSPSTAAVLSPALALIISIAGSQLWRLFQFALHQIRATKQEKNFLYHQQQITLRNTATDLNTLWRLVRLAFAWRHHTDVRVLWQSLPLIAWTLLHLTVVILIGLFSSWLLHANDYVLSRSPWCGQYNNTFLQAAYGDLNSSDDVIPSFEYANHINSRFALVQQHIDICEDSIHGCGNTSINGLTYKSKIVSGYCPFANSVCHPGNETILFDTGYMSSATHLGFNVPPHDRVSFRLKAECAPLDDVKHVTGWKLVNDTSGLPPRQVSDALYGPGPGLSRNATFSFTKQNMDCEQRALLPPYVLNSEYCQPGKYGACTFEPIPELRSTDADLSLVMLMFNGLYGSPVSDPWFTARLAHEDVDAYCTNTNITMYDRETPLTTMGCKQQWQICNTDSPSDDDSTHCTTLQGIQQMSETFATPEQLTTRYTSRQLATVTRIIQAATQSSFFYLVYALQRTNGAPVKARDLISGISGISPPDTQWQIEAKYWMDILLDYLQQSSMDSSTGQFSPKTRYINATAPESDPTGSAYSLCRNQLIRSTVYRNFNFFALLLCVVLCTIITILGLSIEDIIGYIRLHRSRDTAHHDKRDMWIINSDLEIFRAFIEFRKRIPWGRSPFGIPLAPVGAKADIEDLRSDILEAKAGHGIINKNVERRQTATKIALSPEKRRAHTYGAHTGHKHCATCESFEVFPSNNDNSSNGTMFAQPTAQRDDSSGFYFSNEIPAHMAQSDVPRLRDDSRTPQQIPVPHINGYNTINSSESLEVDAINRSQPFHYRSRSPLSRNISADSREARHNSGYSTPIYTQDAYDQNHGRALFTGEHVRDGSDSSDDDRVGRTRGIWPWSRRNDSSGTIC